MQYEIANHAGLPEPETIERLLHAIDNTALADRDSITGSVRVTSIVAADELMVLLDQAGFEVASSKVTRLASECCGGCGG